MKTICAPDLNVPDCDAAEYSHLPVACKREHLAWKQEFGSVADGNGRLQDRLARVAERMGVSAKTVRRKWDCAHHCGWRGVIDRRKEHLAAQDTVPAGFWDFFRALCETEGRSCRQAWKKILTMWHAELPIPGYAVTPPAGVAGLPDGWSYANAMRHAPTAYELKAARIGPMAAAANRPLVLTTRAGLKIGEVYMFDDVWHDVLVNFVGVSREAIRPLEMCCLDVASASKVAYGMLPRIKREDGTNTNLSEREMRQLVVSVLLNQGYRPEGTLLTVEHGTAAIRPGSDFATALDAITGGAVRVARGGIQDASVVLGGWSGAKRGDFKMKAALESIHGLSHNALAALPGQTGSNSRDNKPEKLTGMLAYNNKLLRQVEALPSERVAGLIERLAFPLLHWHDYRQIVDDVYRMLDNRTMHDLEGWEANGWTTQEYRLATSEQKWLPGASIKKMELARQDAVLDLIRSPGLMRVRKLSPGEVWRAGSDQLIKLRHEHVPLLLGPDLAEVKRLDKHHCFVVQGQEYGGGDELRFMAARITNAMRHDVVLDPSRDYKVFANPFDTSMLFVCDMDLRYIGMARRQVGVSRADIDEIHKAIGKVAHQRAALDAPIRARHASEATERKAMIDHNEEVFATITGGVGPQKVGDKTVARRIKQSDDATMDDMSELAVVAGVETPAASIDDML
jgi:hypothetical protein